MFSRATITLGIGPHSSFKRFDEKEQLIYVNNVKFSGQKPVCSKLTNRSLFIEDFLEQIVSMQRSLCFFLPYVRVAPVHKVAPGADPPPQVSVPLVNYYLKVKYNLDCVEIQLNPNQSERLIHCTMWLLHYLVC